MVGGIEIGRFRDRPTRFGLVDPRYVGKTLRITASAEEPIDCVVDRFLRFELSAEEAARLERLALEGTDLAVRVL